jgi:hypothetical protein
MIREAVRFDSNISEPDVALGFSHSLHPKLTVQKSSRPCGNSLSSAAWLSIQLEVLSEFSEQGNPLKKDLSNTCIRQRLIY